MQSLPLSNEHLQQILADVQQAYPHEACGMIGGMGVDAMRVITIKNVSDTPKKHYQLEASAQLKALKAFEEDGLDWIAVYHSHPHGKPIPSLEDIREATLNTPKIIHLIVGLRDRQPNLQAWRIYDGQVDPVELLIGKQQLSDIKPASRIEVWAVLFAVIIGIMLLLAISFNLLPPAPPIPTPQ